MNKFILCLLALVSIAAYGFLADGAPPVWTPSLWFLIIPVITAALAVTALLFYHRDSVEEFFENRRVLYRCRAVHTLLTLWFLSPILGNGTAVVLRWVGYPEVANAIWEMRYLPLAGAIAGIMWSLFALAMVLFAIILSCGIWTLVRDIIRWGSQKMGGGSQLA